MRSRSTAPRLFAALALATLLAGCGAPLSEQWRGHPGGPGTGAETREETNHAPANPAGHSGTDCSKVKCVALTFDDGPGPYTASLLDILDEHHAKATFFLIGKNVAKHPEIAREELDRGHEIGNHTWSHADLAKISRTAGQRELRKADEAITKAAGAAPTLVRPPYGTMRDSLKKSQSVPVALWSEDTLDWKTRDTKKTVKAAEAIKPGSIVLMHDIHKSTVDAIPKILGDLGSLGYHFVTVSELVGTPKPGIGYKTGRHPATKN